MKRLIDLAEWVAIWMVFYGLILVTGFAIGGIGMGLMYVARSIDHMFQR